MMDTLIYRAMQPQDTDAVAAMILGSFEQFIAPDLSEEGRQAIREFISAAALIERQATGSLILLALDGAAVAGIIEIRDDSHLSLLFVATAYHRRGIARAMLDLALSQTLERNPTLTRLTVNSSPYAVGAYHHLGFATDGDRFERNGIVAYPLVLDVAVWRAR